MTSKPESTQKKFTRKVLIRKNPLIRETKKDQKKKIVLLNEYLLFEYSLILFIHILKKIE